MILAKCTNKQNKNMGTKIKFLLLSVLMSNILHSQSNENVNILKKYALHKCLMNNYYKVDSLFISHDYTPSYLFQVKSIDYDLLDKINVYSEKNTSNYYRNGVQENLEDPKANYIFWNCMDFYEPKELDNYVKKILGINPKKKVIKKKK